GYRGSTTITRIKNVESKSHFGTGGADMSAGWCRVRASYAANPYIVHAQFYVPARGTGAYGNGAGGGGQHGGGGERRHTRGTGCALVHGVDIVFECQRCGDRAARHVHGW